MKVVVKYEGSNRGQVFIDGHDVKNCRAVTVHMRAGSSPPRVVLELLPTFLEVDLPEAQVKALRLCRVCSGVPSVDGAGCHACGGTGVVWGTVD